MLHSTEVAAATDRKVRVDRSAAKSELNVKNFDRGGLELRVGDRVGFIMRGWFLPREQESFGVIQAIDHRGCITIDVMENYRRFTSFRRVGLREKTVLYTHYVYDAKTRRRIYDIKSNDAVLGEHRLSIFRVNNDEFEEHVKQQIKNDASGELLDGGPSSSDHSD